MKSLLYIDDNVSEAVYLKAKINKLCRFYSSVDGGYNKNLTYHLIIIDVNLGGKSGFELYFKLKKIHTDTFFIVTSSLLPPFNLRLEGEDIIVSKGCLLNSILKWLKYGST